MSATARPLLLLSHEIHMDVLASYASSEDDSDGPGQPKDAFRGQCQFGKIQLIGRKRKALPGAGDLLAGASGGLPMLSVLCLPQSNLTLCLLPVGDAIGLEYRAGRPDPEAAQCPEQHQGRSRRFKHAEGNYATSVFIPGQQGPCVHCCATEGSAVLLPERQACRHIMQQIRSAFVMCNFTDLARQAMFVATPA